LEQAMALFYQEKYDECIPMFEKVVEQDAQNTLAMSYILHAAYKQKNIDEIVGRIEQRAVARGEDPTAATHLGMAYFLRGMIIPNQLDEALTEFKQAIKDDPQLAMAYTGLGMVYFQKRMMPRAKGYLIRALRINPHDIMAVDLLGNIMLVDEKKPADALQLYERCIAELPTYPDGHYYAGSCLYDLKRYDEAIAQLTQARDLDPKGITKGFDAATLLGDCYSLQGRTAEAIEAFEHAKKIRPDSKYVDIKLQKLRGESKDE
ncbi:MAG: tetratricopeptide repeat protein, partial [Candidatus Eremiobacteraeota bacterium]|nr:tetratricopeptide repeat protein [Candidatus Eremiobacteraeota bacterium]